MSKEKITYILTLWERGLVSMLSKTIRKNLTDINNLKMRTKATKYSNMFSSEPTVTAGEEEKPDIVAELEEELRNYKMVEMEVEDDNEDDLIFDELSSDSPKVTLDEITDYIVENPEEVIVEFPLTPVVELTEKLPFFKSIKYKLANS
jgi:hypothetical protein